MTKRQRHFMVGEPRPHVGSEHQMWVGDCKCGETCLPAPNRLSAIIFVKNHALTATQKELAALQEKFDAYRDGVEAAEREFPDPVTPALVPGIPWSNQPTSVESPPENPGEYDAIYAEMDRRIEVSRNRGEVEDLCVIALSPYLMEGFEAWLAQRQMMLSTPLPDGDGREIQVVLPSPHVWESLVNNPRDDDE